MLEFVMVWKADVQKAMFIAALLLAWRFGAGPERLCAGVLVLAKIADLTIRVFHTPSFASGSVLVEYLALDLATLAAFVALAIRANRVYPIWLTSIQGVSVMSHFAAGLITTSPIAYAVMAILPSYLLILVVFLGILAHWRRERRFGATQAWRGDPPIASPASSVRSRQD